MEFVDQIEGATYDHAVRILKALAKLHTSTWGPRIGETSCVFGTAAKSVSDN